MLLAIANTLTTYGVRPTIIKDHLEAAADLAYDRWNSFSRITVSQNQTVPPAMFGASPRMPDSTIEQRALNTDGGAGTALYRFDGNLESLALGRVSAQRDEIKAASSSKAMTRGIWSVSVMTLGERAPLFFWHH